MAKRSDASEERKAARGTSGGRGARTEHEVGWEIGWSAEPDGEQDDILFRRVLFWVLAVVISFMGVWFAVTSSGVQDAQPVLSANDDVPGPATRYAVRLLCFAPSKRATADRLVARDSIRALAAGCEFHFVKLAGGQCALCVGRFESEDSPDLHRLLEEFRTHREQGRRLFPEADVVSFTDRTRPRPVSR
jgi:hypothetical protein